MECEFCRMGKNKKLVIIVAITIPMWSDSLRCASDLIGLAPEDQGVGARRYRYANNSAALGVDRGSLQHPV